MRRSDRTRATRRLHAYARRGEWHHRLARDLRLDHLVDLGWDEPEVIDLAIYRAHHAATLRAASPLALDLLRHERLDVDHLARRLRPDGKPDRWICGGRMIWDGKIVSPGGYVHCAASVVGEDARYAFLHGGLEVRPWDDPAGGLGLRLSPAGLEIGAQLGEVHLRTFEKVATLTVDAGVPRTIMTGAVGLRVDQFFDHPIFAGRGYVIERSEDHRDDLLRKGPPWPWRVKFRAEPVPWRVPWLPASWIDQRTGDHLS